jgi:hypothetical protein
MSSKWDDVEIDNFSTGDDDQPIDSDTFHYIHLRIIPRLQSVSSLNMQYHQNIIINKLAIYHKNRRLISDMYLMGNTCRRRQ